MGVRLITAWLCNLIDTAATIHLFLQYGNWELNPISAWLLGRSPLLFAGYKLLCMTALVVLCWWKRDWKLSKAASWLVFVNYTAVTVYYMAVYAAML